MVETSNIQIGDALSIMKGWPDGCCDMAVSKEGLINEV